MQLIVFIMINMIIGLVVFPRAANKKHTQLLPMTGKENPP